MQEAGPAVLEEPDRENGEGEQQDEDEQVGAVLPVALLGLLLGHDLLVHGSRRSAGAVRSPGPAKDAHCEEQPERPHKPAGPGAAAAATVAAAEGRPQPAAPSHDSPRPPPRSSPATARGRTTPRGLTGKGRGPREAVGERATAAAAAAAALKGDATLPARLAPSLCPSGLHRTGSPPAPDTHTQVLPGNERLSHLAHGLLEKKPQLGVIKQRRIELGLLWS